MQQAFAAYATHIKDQQSSASDPLRASSSTPNRSHDLSAASTPILPRRTKPTQPETSQTAMTSKASPAKHVKTISPKQTTASKKGKEKAVDLPFEQRDPSDPQFVPRSEIDLKNTMRDRWKPSDWNPEAPPGSDIPQPASQQPRFGECEHWVLYQQHLRITPYTLPPKNCFLGSLDIYQWLKLAHIDGFVSPYALNQLNPAFSKANGYVLTSMRPMGRGVYTKVGDEICVIVFAGYYALCGDIGIQAWRLANPNESLATHQPWVSGSINIGKTLVDQKKCKILDAVPLRKTKFACLLDPAITSRLTCPRLGAFDFNQSNIVGTTMNEGYLARAFSSLPDENYLTTLRKLKKFDAELRHNRKRLNILTVADRDRKTKFPRRDQDTHIKELSTTAFLWPWDPSVDGQPWEHDWERYDFNEHEPVFRPIIEAENPTEHSEIESDRYTQPISVESSPVESDPDSSPEPTPSKTNQRAESQRHHTVSQPSLSQSSISAVMEKQNAYIDDIKLHMAGIIERLESELNELKTSINRLDNFKANNQNLIERAQVEQDLLELAEGDPNDEPDREPTSQSRAFVVPPTTPTATGKRKLSAYIAVDIQPTPTSSHRQAKKPKTG